MEENILVKPYSTILYRQSSIESVKNISLNSDIKSLPKVVDVTVKTPSKVNTESYGKTCQVNEQEEIFSVINSSNKLKYLTHTEINYAVPHKSNDEQEVIRISEKKEKVLPKPKKIDKNVEELHISKSIQGFENEKIFIPTSSNSSSGSIYSDMKSSENKLNMPAPGAECAKSCSDSKALASESNDQQNFEYVEMKITPNQQYLEKCSGQYENVGNSHIYEELKADDEVNPSVALIAALNVNQHRREEYETTNISNENMATGRPKSPKPIITKTEKDESFWDKIGTLGRKKRIKEVQEIQEEGKYAIDSPGFAIAHHVSPEEYDLDEKEERSIVMPKAFEDPRLGELIQVLIDWINDELASQRIIVQDLTEDLYDGQVFQKLFEMLTAHKLDVPEVTQSEEGQKQKLSVVLSHFNKVLGLPHNHNKWNVEVIHSKSIVPILHLLVALARHFRPPVRLPENVSVPVTVVQKTQGQLTHRIVREVITSEYSDVGMICERDAFDTLFDHAPEKLQVVKKSMVTFVNKHLNKLNLEVTEIETQFHDGVYLLMLMGLLEGFFVPLYSFFPTPKDNDQKVHNVCFAFELMEEIGLAKPKARPEDVVNLDLKSTLRVLYNLFNKYKFLL